MNYYTHAGLFHADEVFGYAICRMAMNNIDLVRLTDLSMIPDDGIVADIGREWAPGQRKFDHHQGFFTRENGMPYASAGMIWEAYGPAAVKKVAEIDSEDFVNEVWLRVDETLIQGIDAHDSDNKYKLEATCSGGKVRVMSLPNVISSFNSQDVSDHEAQYDLFKTAAELAEIMIENHIEQAVKFIEANNKFVDVAIFSKDDKFIILEEGMPWKEIVHEEYPETLYVISPSNHPGSPFSMIAVPVEPESREVKCPIERPSWFEGFIHQGKWIAGGQSVDELINLAEYNIANNGK